MSNLFFIKQYLKRPRTVGAVLPSSKHLAKKMVQNIDFENARHIVEYGPGTGVFTDQLLHKRQPDAVVLLVEKNIIFYDLLKEKYKDSPNLHIINGSAENIGTYLKEHDMDQADCIISGLPFASIPRDISSAILTQTKLNLKPGGHFITFQYTLLKKALFDQYFDSIIISREMRNLPPAYVLCCTNP